LASIFEKAEAELARTQHPDPYRREFRFGIIGEKMNTDQRRYAFPLQRPCTRMVLNGM
jgi:hypothetical protein